MTSFASLMALSRSQTESANAAVEQALADRKRREEQQRKQREEREAKQRELERKLVAQRMEERRKEEERQGRRKAEEERREQALRKAQEERVYNLLHGKKATKPSTAPRARSGSPSGKPKRKADDDDDGPAAAGLTREELRERKKRAEERRLMAAGGKRPTASLSTTKYRKRLPGGAVDVIADSSSIGLPAPANNAEMSTKDRLAKMPNTLVMLNVQKRDRRTAEESLAARKPNVLSGDDAKRFDGWFDKPKKDVKKPAASTSQSLSPAPMPPSNSRPAPAPAVLPTQKKATLASPAPKMTAARGGSMFISPAMASAARALSKANARTGDKTPLSTMSFSKNRPNVPKAPIAAPSKSLGNRSSLPSYDRDRRGHNAGPPAKRARSDSYSDSSPPPKRRYRDEEEEELPDEASAFLSLLRRKRMGQVQDVFSDDDMEADAMTLEEEEKWSARIAKEEDLRELEAERKHELEKARRKKERTGR